MPEALIVNPGGAFGLPLTQLTPGGLNDQNLLEVVNNSGGHLQHGDVVTWDVNTALVSTNTLSVGAQQLAVSATVYNVTPGTGTNFTVPSIVVAVGVTPTGFTQPMNLVGLATAVAANTVTIAFARAGAAGSLPANTIIFQTPNSLGFGTGSVTSPFSPPQNIGQPAAPSDGGRNVTVSSVAAGSDLKVAGVVTVTGDASTNAGLVRPGQNCFIACDGVARVQVAGITVAAGVGITTAAAQPTTADDLAGLALGNMIGVSLEANTARDVNNTIRAAIKIG